MTDPKNTETPAATKYAGIWKAPSGRIIDLNSPNIEMIDISDISHILSRLCAFEGCSAPFYSLAQHCALMARLAPDELKREALLHRATAAYIDESIKPYKVIQGGRLEEVHAAFEKLIAEKFGLSRDMKTLMQINGIDLQVIEMEHQALFKREPGRLAGYLRATNLEMDGKWAWPQQTAESQFKSLYHHYFTTSAVS